MISIELLDSQSPADRLSTRYLKTYKVWKKTWSEEYAQLGLPAPLHSDNFTRQKYVVSIFAGEECAALSCLHTLDLTHEHGLDDSWLKPWPKEVLAQIRSVNKRVLLWNSFTVEQSFRGRKFEGIPIKDIVSASCVRAFGLLTDFQLMLGSTRNNRKVNQSLYDVGGSHLATVDYFGEPTDLIWFQRSLDPALAPDRESLLHQCWVEKGHPDKDAAA